MAKALDVSEVLRHVHPGRRAFLRKLLAGTFAAPLISSFSMGGVSVGKAEAGVLLSSNTGLDCIPPEFYLGDPDLPRRLFKADFQDTNAANVRIRVQARFDVAPDLGSVAFKLKLSRRQTAEALVIRAARESTTGGVREEEILAVHDLSGLPSNSQGVITQGFSCDLLGPLIGTMAQSAARLEIQLADGSRLRGAILPIA